MGADFSYFLLRTLKLQEWLLSLPHLLQLREEKLVIAASLWGPGITQCHLQVPSLSTDSGHLLGSMLMSFFFLSPN